VKDVIAYETFKDIPNIRFFDKIKIYVDFPYSEVTFDKLDFELASRIVGLQFLGGYNDNDDLNRIIYFEIQIEIFHLILAEILFKWSNIDD
jgi:hypothetical protein